MQKMKETCQNCKNHKPCILQKVQEFHFIKVHFTNIAKTPDNVINNSNITILNSTITRHGLGTESYGIFTTEGGVFIYDVSYEWYAVMGVTVCITVGLLVSYLTTRWPTFDHRRPDNLVYNGTRLHKSLSSSAASSSPDFGRRSH